MNQKPKVAFDTFDDFGPTQRRGQMVNPVRSLLLWILDLSERLIGAETVDGVKDPIDEAKEGVAATMLLILLVSVPLCLAMTAIELTRSLLGG